MISFIIPTLNEEKTIENTIKSINNFSGEKEIIISDGSSRDKTVEIARRYTDKVLVHNNAEGRQNIPQGRNAGAKIATGEYIVFVDADVTILNINNFIARGEEYFKRDKKLVAITAGCIVFDDMATIFDKIIFKLLAFYFTFLNFIRFGAAGGEFQMIKREAFLKIGGFDEKLAASEDMDLFWRLAKIGKTKLPIGFNVYHTGRRAHNVGWPKLLWQWSTNTIKVFFFRKAPSEWKEIR